MSTIDIFQFGRALNEQFPDLGEFDAPAVDTTIDELAHSREEIVRIVAELNRLTPGDYAGLAQLLTDLQGLLEHTADHIQEAMPHLQRLLEAVSDRSEPAAARR